MLFQIILGVIAPLAQAGFDPVYGARPLRRAIRAAVEDPAAEALLSGALAAGDGAQVVSREGRAELRLLPKKEPSNDDTKEELP